MTARLPATLRAVTPASLMGHHSGIRFVTPDERHHGRENDVLANRVRVAYVVARFPWLPGADHRASIDAWQREQR